MGATRTRQPPVVLAPPAGTPACHGPRRAASASRGRRKAVQSPWRPNSHRGSNARDGSGDAPKAEGTDPGWGRREGVYSPKMVDLFLRV